MTPYEKETHIQWNDEEDFITIFTCHKKIMNKMEKLKAKVIDKVVMNGNLRHVEYQIPKSKINIGLNPKRVLSSSQKKQLQERMSSMTRG
jgi:hypothetical protein